jgi:hypothetical protein
LEVGFPLFFAKDAIGGNRAAPHLHHHLQTGILVQVDRIAGSPAHLGPNGFGIHASSATATTPTAEPTHATARLATTTRELKLASASVRTEQ